MVGKDPHRIQGKKGADEWDMRRELGLEAEKRAAPLEPKPEALPESDRPQGRTEVAGSRPGVPSLVKDALARRAARDEEA